MPKNVRHDRGVEQVHGVAEAGPDEFWVGYVGEDDTQHRVPLADAPAVHFEVITPARRLAARKNSGICRACGGHPRSPVTSGMSRGWNAITRSSTATSLTPAARYYSPGL
jgi:hypothetical protein